MHNYAYALVHLVYFSVLYHTSPKCLMSDSWDIIKKINQWVWCGLSPLGKPVLTLKIMEIWLEPMGIGLFTQWTLNFTSNSSWKLDKIKFPTPKIGSCNQVFKCNFKGQVRHLILDFFLFPMSACHGSLIKYFR